jgi:hypothetical protein
MKPRLPGRPVRAKGAGLVKLVGDRTSYMMIMMAILLAALATQASADPQFPTEFPDGANALFAGHSFFVPIAGSFNNLAVQNGFSSHQMDSVFASGPAGSPRMLWENADKKAAITAKLSTGQVELFGLTSYPENLSTFKDFELWFDLALTYNPNTTFYIGQPFVVGGPNVPTSIYDQQIEEAGQKSFQVVTDLRKAYPNNDIIFMNYGKTASIMKFLFEAGDLPDIKGLVPDPQNGIPPAEALFADGLLGHAGPMMTELSALSWMSILYGADIKTLVYTNYKSDVERIVQEVLTYNEQFLHVPQPEIKVNGQDGPLTVKYGTNLTVDISLDPGPEAGSNADWWVVIDTAYGWYWYDLGTGKYVPGQIVTHHGPLFTLNPYTVLNAADLPPGDYTLYFGVDGNMNGAPDLGQMYMDSIDVTVLN